MRKLSIILSLLIASVACFSQSIVPRTNSSYTVMDSRFRAQYNLFVPAYADTTAANLQKGIDSLGAVIFTYNTMTLWVRSQSPKVWVEVGSGGGGGNTIYTGDGTLSGDRTISLNGNSISVLNSGAEFLHIDPTPGAEHTHIQAYNTTGGGNYSGNILQVSNTVASASFASTFDAGTKQASIIAIADVSNAVINYSADVHTFTGTVVIPSPFTLGATSVLTSGAELNFVDGVTSNIQTQLDAKLSNVLTTTGDIIISSSGSTAARLAAGTATYVLTSNGAGVAPSWQVIPSDNLIVVNAGSGTQTWFTSGDSLYMKMVKNTTFISTTTDTDSSLLLSLSATGTPSASTYLRGDNTWATIAGGGDVTKVGTPINNQLGVWTGDGTIEGDANLTFASSTLNIGVAGAATGIFTQSGVTSGTITFQPASAAGTYTLTWPTNDGDASQVLTTNGSGVLSWTTPTGGTSGQLNLITHTSGTTWTTPSDITASTRFKITLVGGGGGGAGRNGTNLKGSGGGAGGALVVYVTGLTASTGYTMAIGAAGAGGTGSPQTDGTAGGNTTLTIGATTYTGNGGGGGSATLTPGGAGGTATNGDINITGQSGDASSQVAAAGAIGSGGGSPAFGLGVGAAPVYNTSGADGTGYGAGGGGGVHTAAAGGNGTQGIIIIEYVN